MQQRKTEDETVGWHHRFNGYELGQTPGDGEGQDGEGHLLTPGDSELCCSQWGHKDLDTT